VRPFLLKRMGAAHVLYRAFPVRSASAWPKAGDRREFLRARLADDGQVEIFRNQSSGVLTSCAWADGFVDLDIGKTIQPGDWVRFIPFPEVLG